MRAPTLVLALTLALSACGGATDPASLNDAGAKALNSGDYLDAFTQYDAAVTALGADTGNAQYNRAMWGFIEAGAHVDAGRAEDVFLDYAKANSAVMSAKDYIKVATWLADADNFTEATHVGKAGLEAYTESPALDAVMNTIQAAAAKAGDTEAVNEMESLGYIGDD